MKKYKLIKEYPGSASLNTVAYNYGGQSNFEPINSGKYYSSYQIPFEKYPEFWEEIKEKDYEILSFNHKGKIFRKSGYEFHLAGYGSIGEKYCLLNPTSYTINSVKRLSDREIFTIGDEVTYKLDKDKWTIKSLSINSDGDYMMAAVGSLSDPWCCISNKEFKKLKQKIFTTEDGVDIFEGDNRRVWFVDLPMVAAHLDTAEQIKDAYHYTQQGCNKYKYFSTEQAADDWHLKNRKCLSYNDIKSIYTQNGYESLPKILELVKSR